MANEHDDSVQHGIDDNPTGDAEKGAALGGVGGAVTGAIAGSMVGPVGAVIGGAIGAVAGAVGSGLGVAAVDRMDNDDTITGLGGGATRDAEDAVADTAANVRNDLSADAGLAGTTTRQDVTTTHTGITSGQFDATSDADQDATLRGGRQGFVSESELSSMRDSDRGLDLNVDDFDTNYYSGSSYDADRRYYDETSGRAYTGQELSNSFTDDQRRTLRLREERLDVQKQRVQAGEVTLRKEVITENQTINVPTTREEIVIERHAVTDGDAINAGEIREGEEIRVPLMREEVTVEKTQVVTGEVSIGKREVTENQQITESVRREEARVENTGDARVVERGDGLSTDTDPNTGNR